MENQAGVERQCHLEFEIMDEVVGWVLDPSHNMGWKTQYLNLVALH